MQSQKNLPVISRSKYFSKLELIIEQTTCCCLSIVITFHSLEVSPWKTNLKLFKSGSQHCQLSLFTGFNYLQISLFVILYRCVLKLLLNKVHYQGEITFWLSRRSDCCFHVKKSEVKACKKCIHFLKHCHILLVYVIKLEFSDKRKSTKSLTPILCII